MITNQTLTNQSKPSSGQPPTNKLNRRSALIGGALAGLLSSSLVPAELVMAEGAAEPNNLFILLLRGIYEPVVQAGNLGLSSVDLDDGSYVKNKIYPIFGIKGSNNQSKAIGTFYVQGNGNLCAYDLPGGAIAMSFNSVPPGAPPGYNSPVSHPDGKGGQFLNGTFELTILEATGIYRAFAGGHNHMVDKLHQLSSGKFDEFCLCNISTYQFP